jgi:hypothetical protein
MSTNLTSSNEVGFRDWGFDESARARSSASESVSNSDSESESEPEVGTDFDLGLSVRSTVALVLEEGIDLAACGEEVKYVRA